MAQGFIKLGLELGQGLKLWLKIGLWLKMRLRLVLGLRLRLRLALRRKLGMKLSLVTLKQHRANKGGGQAGVESGAEYGFGRAGNVVK